MNGISTRPPIEPPEVRTLIAVPRWRRNQRAAMAPGGPPATPPDASDIPAPYTTASTSTLLAAAIKAAETPNTTALPVTTTRPPKRSISEPISTWLAPLANQPIEAAIEITPTVVENSRSQVSTKIPNAWRRPIPRAVEKNSAPITYQP